ncbi:glycosyltransferase [Deefgea tanakiae]|uniref:Glycosyltransferase n=1 Tax=Deefgea tanakiae TaxID=2865840 RepID=A0ABX8ZAX1_9NEIS|nr:glycosyltransferase [Deefgea tanakiae]QZA78315.1 glycosyltransferase [Deefgea tanakiae]
MSNLKFSVGLVVTNFNNSNYTEALILSSLKCECIDKVKIVVVDNDSEYLDRERIIALKESFPFVDFILNSSNLGYFPGLNVGMQHLKVKYPDINYVVVGNNDLEFTPDFFSKLMGVGKDVYWTLPVISPDIVTLDGVHQNPHVISDVSEFRKLIWQFYYSNYYLSCVILKIASLTKKITSRRDYLKHEEPLLISQGYGACYILTPVFFEYFTHLWAPTFLMGEEFFIRLQLESKGFHIYYDPRFVVKHHDHATIGKLPTRKLWEISKKSHDLMKRYSPTIFFKKKPEKQYRGEADT